MKIAHVVTYVSRDAAFGGPLSVAVAQTRELARLGHDVTLLAGWDRRASLEVPGVKVELFPVKRAMPGALTGLVAPGLASRLRRERFDAIHVHLGRDLISMPAAVAAASSEDSRLVVQTHGMVMPDTRAMARVFDRAFTRRLLKRVDFSLALTDAERAGLTRVGFRSDRVISITNGVTIEPHSDQPRRNEVLFLARLHPRKRVMTFAAAAAMLLAQGCDADFVAIGPDEGDLDAFQKFAAAPELAGKLRHEGAIPPGAAPRRLAQAAVYVLPSFGEIVPMSVLEAMSVGTPSIITVDCGLAQDLGKRGAALVCDGSAEELASAIKRLLGDPSLAQEIAAAGRRALIEQYSASTVAEQLVALYCGAELGL